MYSYSVSPVEVTRIVSPYREIRVAARAFTCPSTVTLTLVTTTMDVLLDSFTIDCMNSAEDTRTYDVPGTTLRITVNNRATVVVWGRAM